MTVTDEGYPVAQKDTASVVVNVERDRFTPDFTDNGQYFVSVQEDAAVDQTLITVSASRSNIIVIICYKIEITIMIIIFSHLSCTQASFNIFT